MLLFIDTQTNVYLFQIFSRVGRVLKIVTFNKNGKFNLEKIFTIVKRKEKNLHTYSIFQFNHSLIYIGTFQALIQYPDVITAQAAKLVSMTPMFLLKFYNAFSPLYCLNEISSVGVNKIKFYSREISGYLSLSEFEQSSQQLAVETLSIKQEERSVIAAPPYSHLCSFCACKVYFIIV